MHKSELPADPDLTVPAIPVICDKCRETGFAGDEAFSAIPDILSFTPVQRRAHVNGWKEEHQRAFIAALAITGSPRQAARAIGKHQFGAEQLRNHRTGKSFAAAWDAAMELARERETHRISLAELSRSSPDRERAEGRNPSGGLTSTGRAVEGAHAIHPDCDYDPEFHADDYPEYWETMNRIRDRLLRARRMHLFLIHDDEAKRRAWEVLVGPVDWDKAERLEPQPDEPVRDPMESPLGMPNRRQPDMLLTAEAGLLPEITGGPDALAELKEALASAEAEGISLSEFVERDQASDGAAPKAGPPDDQPHG